MSMRSRNGTRRKFRIVLLDRDAFAYMDRLALLLPECEVVAADGPPTWGGLPLVPSADLVVVDPGVSDPLRALDLFFGERLPFIPIIVAAGKGSEELAVRAFRLGALDYFSKPFRKGEFAARVRGLMPLDPPHVEEDHDTSDPRLDRALKYILENYFLPISLLEISRVAGMSTSCFERNFKRVMEVTFKTYLINLRLARAMVVIAERNLSMYEVACACGFTNQYHFSRTFSKKTGLPPRSYKKLVSTPQSGRSHSPLAILKNLF
ncbi:MAG: AraC family transcriptional regulator [Deltaproteobacteria bacterium]|nr:MAG: AraC family transcriptional regulator [Deltaproteobacteria bacterium]